MIDVFVAQDLGAERYTRTGSWVNCRDNLAAAKSWRRAQQVADGSPTTTRVD